MVINTLANVNNITKFNINANKIDNEKLESCANKILSNNKIKSFYIGNNKLKEEGAKILSMCLIKNNLLTALGNRLNRYRKK